MRALLALCVWLLVATAPSATRADWPQARQGPSGRAFVELTLGDSSRPASSASSARSWRFRGGSHVWGYQPGMSVWSSAAIAKVGKRAIVVAGSYDKSIYCLDALSGEKRWRYTTGGGVYAAPTIWRRRLPQGKTESWVFAASSDRLVYALDADLGRRKWVYSVQIWRPTIGGARLSSPVVGRVGVDAALFFAHWVWDKSLRGHLQAGGLTALSAIAGKRLWSTRLGDSQLSSPVYLGQDARRRGRGRAAERGGLVFVASENGNLYALDGDSGALRWTRPQRNMVKASPALFFHAGRWRVVIGSKHGMVRCYDAEDGKTLWRYKTGHWVDGSAAVASIDGQPLVFVGSYDMHLHAIDGRNGKRLWTYRTAGGVYGSPAVIRRQAHDQGSKRKVWRTEVLISSWDHHLHAVDAANGAQLWSAYMGRPLWQSITLGDSVWSSPSLARIDGRDFLYFGSYAGPIHGVPLDEAARKALARPSSNIDFWITLPLVLLAVAAFLVLMTRRERRQRQPSR
jgi:outer membrane protein assembly factor BamB